MTDQEGGQVRRLPGAPAMSEKQIGASANPVVGRQPAGTGAGQNLAGVGMNVNLAPGARRVLQVRQLHRPVPALLQQQRRRSCAAAGGASSPPSRRPAWRPPPSTSPGLGSATKSQNTDAGPVTLNVSLSGLRTKDEAPYPVAITAGVKLIMASWADLPGAGRRPARPGCPQP